jgi:hypothetical protein
MSFSPQSVINLLSPGVAYIFAQAQDWPNYKPFKWEMAYDFETDDLLLAAFGKTMTLTSYYEICDGSYKHRVAARLEHWVEKNKPKRHKRYTPIPQIKTRRPLAA